MKDQILTGVDDMPRFLPLRDLPVGRHTDDPRDYPHQDRLLASFWRRAQVCRSAEHRCDLLQRWAAVRVHPLTACGRHNVGRFREYALKWAAGCWVCGADWIDLHHIVPVSRGGTNRADNFVPLCHGCHFRVHG